jgi:hypothetical protein
MDSTSKEQGRRVSREEVFEAAEALSARGAKPTLEAVRRHLLDTSGRGGSFIDLSPLMKEWRQSRQAKRGPAHADVPAALCQRSSLLLSELWTSAMETASHEFLGRQAAIEAQLKECDAEKDDAIQAAESLRLDLVQQREREDLLREQFDRRIEENNKLESQLQQSAQIIGKLEATLKEVRERLSYVERLYEDERNRLAELTAKLARAEAESDSRGQRLAQAELAASKERAKAENAQLEVVRLQQRLQQTSRLAE